MSEPEVEAEYEFDAALSFAGEDREYVDEVASALKTSGVRPFLDSDHLSEMWGEDLVEFFDGVYRRRSRFAIIFVSRHYAEKMWPRHERRSALARALEERGAYVLPVRLDDTELEGLRPTVGYLDSRRLGIEKLVEAFVQKLSGTAAAIQAVDKTPRSPAELQWVVENRPKLWEYLYFAGLLLHERDLLAAKYRDYKIGYVKPGGEWVRGELVADFCSRSLSAALAIMPMMERVMAQDAQESAFGLPGEPGDPEEIQHLAKRWTAIYEQFLDWAMEVRSTVVPGEYRELLQLLERYAAGPIRQYRAFVDKFAEHADQMPTLIENATLENPLRVELALEITVDDGVSAAYEAELNRLLN